MQEPNLLFPTPVLIVEDDPVMQERLESLLVHIGYRSEQLYFAQTLQHAREIILHHDPVIAFYLIDLGLPDGNGKELIEQIRTQDSEVPILVISAWSTQDAILGAIHAGATGYLLKERDDFELTLSIRSIIRGGAPIDPFIAQQILSKLVAQPSEKMPQSSSDIKLSPRELETLHLVAQGMSNLEISEYFNLSRHTVECHIKHIYRKLSVSNRAKAVSTARSLGLLS